MSTKSLARSPNVTDSARVSVIFPGALGDFICFLPALRALLRADRVVLYAHADFAEIVPDGVTVRSIEAAEISRLFVAGTPNGAPDREPFGAFAAVYSWMGSQQPEFVRQLQRATHGRAKIFPFRPAAAEHQMEYYLRCLAVDDVLPSAPSIEIGAAARRWCEDFWTGHSLQDRPVLSIAPGSGAREKNWPEECFIAVADWWRAEMAGVAVLVIGPVEAERGGVDRLREHCLTVGDLNLSQAAALLARSSAYLGNDSGISHLAAAAGAPTVALFGPSDPLQWAPRGHRVSVISRRAPCSPCSTAAMKNCLERTCLKEITPEEVIAALRNLAERASLTRGGVGIRV